MTGPRKKQGVGRGARKVAGQRADGARGAGKRASGNTRNTAQGRGGVTRDSVRPVREKGAGAEQAGSREGPGGRAGRAVNAASAGGRNPARARGGGRGQEQVGARSPEGGRRAAPKTPKVAQLRKPLPELRRVELDVPAPGMVFMDRDGGQLTFPDSSLKRVAARILSGRRKAWRYRPFSFPLFTDRGHEQTFYFDFYVYDAEDSVIKLILVVAGESREVWDKVGRFKRQYPMYSYELWTPERLLQLSKPRAQLGF